MLTHEIIQLSRIPETNFRSLIQQALNHSLWHYLLYFDEKDDVEEQFSCLLKESLAKLLFRFFCLQNNLPIEFKSQNGDRFLSFQIGDYNWELINLTVNGPPLKMPSETATLPAIIPSQKFDCTEKDDFGNKIIRWASPSEKRVLFTYLHNNSESECFLELNLPEGLQELYQDFFDRKNKGKKLRESDFWKKIKPLGTPEFTIRHIPEFYITGWAGPEHWKFFYPSDSNAFPNIKPFSKKNKTILVHRLPAFSRLFSQLNEELHFAKFLN